MNQLDHDSIYDIIYAVLMLLYLYLTNDEYKKKLCKHQKQKFPVNLSNVKVSRTFSLSKMIRTMGDVWKIGIHW